MRTGRTMELEHEKIRVYWLKGPYINSTLGLGVAKDLGYICQRRFHRPQVLGSLS